MDDRPIGFLDSGIGGVTVLNEALKLLPNEDYQFFSDSINNPYGDKTDEEIKSRCDEIVSDLVNFYDCKAIVLACNTASAKAADYLREKYKDLPIVAIEPAYKMVHDYAPDGFTLVMATRGTIESEKFARLYHKYDNGNTDLISCVGMADLIEQGRYDELDVYLENLLGKYKGKVQNVVLGCTHYPLVKDNIEKVLGNVRFFDGSKGVAKQLKRVLEEKDMLSSSTEQGDVGFSDSSNELEMEEEKYDRFVSFMYSED